MSNNTSGGTKYDAGKTRIDLFPGDVLFAISDILTFGAAKYADRNWENGMNWGRVFGALMRHMWSWWQGKAPTNENFMFGDLDPETQRSHLWHAGCCMVFLIAYEMRGIGTDDRPQCARVTEEKDVAKEFDNTTIIASTDPNAVESGGLSHVQADLQSGTTLVYRNGNWYDQNGGMVRYSLSGNLGCEEPIKVWTNKF